MQTLAWHDKQLTTALASWTELRHDTILYAKQSYTPTLRALPPREKPVVGYVEPVAAFYNRLSALTKMTSQGLDEMQVLEEAVGYVKLIVVARKVSDGRILVGVGPVMSYYEFKQAMKERLTDPGWRDVLGSTPPDDREWVVHFSAAPSAGAR